MLITIMCGMFGWMVSNPIVTLNSFMHVHTHCGMNTSTQYIYARPDQLEVFEGSVIPWCQNCTNAAVQQGLGVVGAVIMPHNLYLHSGLVLVSR